MSEDADKSELRALVVSFLQQSLQEKPEGYSVQEIERILPDKCDESRDWYKRYKKNSVLEALHDDVFKGVLNLSNSYNTTIVKLNTRSDKVDNHLIDLITHQKASSKKRSFRRPTNRHSALVSFSLNKQYSNHYRRPHCTTRLNHDQQYRGENSFIKKNSPPVSSTFKPNIYSKSYNNNASWSNDPRSRGSSSMVPPQIRPSSTQSKPQPPPSQHSPKSSVPLGPIPRLKQSKPSVTEESSKKIDDPELEQKKSYLRQRIMFLLTKKYQEIKILHLASLYRLQFEESIEPANYGHSTLTSLLQDPILDPYIQFNYGSPMLSISAKNRAQPSGKENIVTGKSPTVNGTNSPGLGDRTNASARTKLEAIDPFNVKSMINSLEPLCDPKEPPLSNIEVDEGVKYKTMRIIFKSPNQCLLLDDWQAKFDQETRLQIRIRDYGFKTMKEFFKHLSLELPIKVKLNDKDQWYAVADMPALSEWMMDKMSKGRYRAITALEAHYELVAFPNDTYNYASPKDLISQNFFPVFILSVKRSDLMWIQLRTPKSIEEHLCIEASMTCYEDYKAKEILKVPNAFIKPGFPCAVFDNSQQRWCRALILKAPENIAKNCEVTALLVDYAVTKIYVTTQLLCLMKTHLKLTVGPIYSKLYGVNSDVLRVAQHTVRQVLQEYTSPPVTLACKFQEAVPSNEPEYLPKMCFVVNLVDTRSGRDCNLADDINLPRDTEE